MTIAGSSTSTSPLIAVLLVTSSSRGENLIFSFPKRPHLLKRYSRIRYYATNTNQEDQSKSKNQNKNKSKSKQRTSDDHDTNQDIQNESSTILESVSSSTYHNSNINSRKPRQKSFETSERDRRSTSKSNSNSNLNLNLNITNATTTSTSNGGNGMNTRDNRYDQDLDDRDRDEQEEDELDSDDGDLDGLTDSEESESSTDADDRDLRNGGEDSDDEISRRDGIGAGDRDRDRDGTNRFMSNSNLERDRQSRSKTRDKIMSERTSKSRVRSASRSRTRQSQQKAGSVGDPSELGGVHSRKDRKSSPSTLKSYTEFLGYPIEVLAALLAPRRELCQQKFELIIDDLAFLGHPVCVREDGNWDESEQVQDENQDDEEANPRSETMRNENEGGRGRTRESRKTNFDSNNNDNDVVGKSFSDPPTSTSHHVHYDETSEIRPFSESKGLRDQEFKNGRSTSKSPSRNPTLSSNSTSNASSNSSQARINSKSKTRSRSKPSSSLTLFHLVLVLSRPSTNPIGSNSALGSTTATSLNGPDSISLSSWLQFWYDNVAFKMAAALYAEQCRCDYVRKEAEGLIALKERCSEDGASYSSYMTQALASSSLARSLRDLHTSIARSSGAFVSINDTIDAHLQLPPLIHDPVRLFNALDLQTELDGNDPVFLAGEGKPEFNAHFEDEEQLDSDGKIRDRNLVEEEKKKLQKLRKSSNSLLPEQFTFIEYTRTTGPFLLPWKTLLTLNDRPPSAFVGGNNRDGQKGFQARKDGAATGVEEDEVLQDRKEGFQTEEEEEEEATLPPSGIESWARKFTSLLKPTLSGVPTFAELADLLEWDLYEDVYPMARHLIYYREARVVDVPRINSTYAISPMLDLEDLPQLSNHWATTFPSLPILTSLLSALSYSLQPFSSHFQISTKASTTNQPFNSGSPSTSSRPSNSASAFQRPQPFSHQHSQTYFSHSQVQRQKQECLHALIWLLRHEVVAPLQVRLRLVATEAVKRKALDLKIGRQEKRRKTLERKKLREERRLKKIKKLRSQALNRAEKESKKESLELERKENERLQFENQEIESPEEDRGRVRSRSRSNPPPNTPPSVNQKGTRKRSNSNSSKNPSLGLMSATRPSTTSTTKGSSSQSSTHQPQISPTVRHQHLARFSPETRKVESLKFERRPISRSRSPSKLLESIGLSSLTPASSSNIASTSGAVSSNGSAGGVTGSGSRPGTPRGRILPINTSTTTGIDGRGRSVSSVEVGVGNNSLPNSAGWSRRGRKSRSPSRARMRVKGFGQDEEITVDDEDQSTNNLSLEEDRKREETSSSTSAKGRISSGLGLTLHLTEKVNSTPKEVQENLSSSNLKSSSKVNEPQFQAEPGIDIKQDSEISDFSISSEETDDDLEDEELENFDQDQMENWEFEASLISEPSRADREESEWIVAMLDGKEEWITQRFLRLLPYLNGKHTVDEIVYREELRRRELRAILSQLSEEIITFVHP